MIAVGEYQQTYDDFKEFVDTLVVALRGMEKSEAPMANVHPVLLCEAGD